MKTFFHYSGMAFLLTHELDAVTQHEWRLLYVLRSLPDGLARDLFVVLHVPLFALLIGLCESAAPRVRGIARASLAAFLVIHVGLHLRLSDHVLYTFHSILSQSIIYGAGLCGFAYWVLLAVPSSRPKHP